MRRTPEATFEVGVSGHGPAAQALVQDVAEQISIWDRRHRDSTAAFMLPDGDPGQSDPAAGRFVLDRPERPIVVTWQ
jgi:protein-L-isoaspartate(D-aspartate) O-methyltransferase